MEEMLDMKYRAAFRALDVEDRGVVASEKVRSFVEAALGSSFDANISEAILSSMGADRSGYVTFQSFKDGFSSKLFSGECKDALYRVLAKGQNFGPLLGDWTKALENLGVTISGEQEVSDIISRAFANTKQLIAMEMQRSDLSYPESLEADINDDQDAERDTATDPFSSLVTRDDELSEDYLGGTLSEDELPSGGS